MATVEVETRQARKRRRVVWDVAPFDIIQVCSFSCFRLLGFRVLSCFPPNHQFRDIGSPLSCKSNLVVPVFSIRQGNQPQDVSERYITPPLRDDDREGHYVFSLGENLTTRCELWGFFHD